MRRIIEEKRPTFFDEKPWQKAQRREETHRRRSATQRKNKNLTIEDMIVEGAKYSQSSGVELKFDSHEDEVNWTRVISWEDEDEIVKRYVQYCA